MPRTSAVPLPTKTSRPSSTRPSSNSPIFYKPAKTKKPNSSLALHANSKPTAPRRKRSTEPQQRGNIYQSDCPTRIILNHVTSNWGLLILIVLLDRTHRFSELVRRIGGVSEKMLAQSLRALETDGFVLRTVYPTIPPKVEYSLTPLGLEIAPLIKTLTLWVEDHVVQIVTLREQNIKSSPSVLPDGRPTRTVVTS